MADIKVYALDKIGVVVDTSPIGNPDGTLTKAQNAVPDPIGEAGSIRKRRGLKPLNASAGAGSVLGGIGVPIALGSAGPNVVNPFTDLSPSITPAQTIVKTTPRGPTFDDESWEFEWDWYFDFPEPDILLSGVDPELGGAGDTDRDQFDIVDDTSVDDTGAIVQAGTTFVPLNFIGTALATGWYVSFDEAMAQHQTYPTLFVKQGLAYPSLGVRTTSDFTFHANNGGTTISISGRTSDVLNNVIYYAATDGTFPILRAFDGYTDKLVATIPNVAGSAALRINSILAANGKIYLTTLTSGVTTSSTGVGRVFQYDPSTNYFSQIGDALPTDQIPHSLIFAYGRLWVGTASESSSARVYFFRPGIDTSWTLDNTFAAGEGIVTDLAIFQGKIYASTLNRTLSGSANLYVRASSNGAWSVSDSGTIDTNAGHIAARGYLHLSVWPPENAGITSPAPALFANRNGCTEDTWPNIGVRQLSGGSWSTVATISATGGSGEFLRLYAINSAKTLIPVLALINGAGAFTSPNGTTWTDRSGNLTITAVAALPTVFVQV